MYTYVNVADLITALQTNSSATSNFSVQNFIYSEKQPSVISTYELSDSIIDHKISQFGPKGIIVYL